MKISDLHLDDIIPPEATSVDKVNYVVYEGTLTMKPYNSVLWFISTSPTYIDEPKVRTLCSIKL